MTEPDSHAEINDWFFRQYFDAWIEIAMGRARVETILDFYDVPFVFADPAGLHRLLTDEDVIAALLHSQRELTEAGYTGTKVLDRRVFVYNRYAACVHAIWSRHDGSEREIQRGAFQFLINRTSKGLRITSIAAHVPTTADTLAAVW